MSEKKKKSAIGEVGIYNARQLGVPKMLILGKIGRASCRERV